MNYQKTIAETMHGIVAGYALQPEIVYHKPKSDFCGEIERVLSGHTKATLSIQSLLSTAQSYAYQRNTTFAYIFLDAVYCNDGCRHTFQLPRCR